MPPQRHVCIGLMDSPIQPAVRTSPCWDGKNIGTPERTVGQRAGRKHDASAAGYARKDMMKLHCMRGCEFGKLSATEYIIKNIKNEWRIQKFRLVIKRIEPIALPTRETARRFVSVNILLSHPSSFEMTLLSRPCVGSYYYSIETLSVSLTVSEIFSVKEWRDLKIGGIGCSRSLKMAHFDRS